MLSELLDTFKIENASIDEETNEYDRRKFISDYKEKKILVLINYAVLTTGFDAPNTEVIMITRPTKSMTLYNQMLGRGIRGIKVGGNEECTLVDIKDNLIGLPDEQVGFNVYNDLWSD